MQHLSQVFRRSVQRAGHRPALATVGSAPVTYAQLERRVHALAKRFTHHHGIARGERVVIAMPNALQYLEALLAAWHAGLCVVPVNAKLHPKEIHYIVEDSGAKLCVSKGDLCAALTTELAPLPVLDVESSAWRDIRDDAEVPAVSDDADDLAWLFYTSGTTGRPKGVMLTHANLVVMSLGVYTDVQAVSADDVLLHAAPMSHGSGLYAVPYLLAGALQVIPASGGFDAAEVFAALRLYQSVSFFAAPTIVTRLVQHVQANRMDDPAQGLRTIIVGGAPFYVEDVEAAVACFGPRIAQIYGQGESPMSITALDSAQVAAAVERSDRAMLTSVGYAQTAVDVVVRDATGKPLPAGEIGEVTVRGPTVMRGYWDNPQATAATLPGGVLYTGDVGRFDARGLLYLMDRSKDVIISGGSNIYPREVEEALLTHPAVREVAVIGVPDPEWGENVVAFVVCSPGAGVDADKLDQHCIAHIARFKRPKSYLFVDTLPQNATGKVLKTELRGMFASR